jgi:hypothetical protein
VILVPFYLLLFGLRYFEGANRDSIEVFHPHYQPSTFLFHTSASIVEREAVLSMVGFCRI